MILTRIRTGLYGSAQELCQAALNQKWSFEVRPAAEKVLKLINFELQPVHQEEMDLVTIKPSQLGFTTNYHWQEVFERAIKTGLSTCEPEVAIYLRMQWNGDYKHREHIIASEPIRDKATQKEFFFELGWNPDVSTPFCPNTQHWKWFDLTRSSTYEGQDVSWIDTPFIFRR